VTLFTNRQIAAICCAIVLAVSVATNGVKFAQPHLEGWFRLFLQVLVGGEEESGGEPE